MQIAENTVVRFDYTLRDSDGQVIDSSEGRGPLTYLHGHANIVPGLEKAMEGAGPGDELSVSVPPEEGYGHYRDELVQDVPREAFGDVDKLEQGMRFRAESETGPVVVTVKEVGDHEVTVDANHDLAGEELQFAVTIREVRPATEEEISHGHVHDGDDES